MKRPPLPLLVLSITLLLAGGLVITTFLLSRNTATHLLDPGPALPSLRLTTQTDQVIDLADPPGEVTVVGLSLTRCEMICPIIVSKMARLQATVQSDNALNGLTLLSIAIDPDHDTLDVVKAYAAKSQADPALWLFARAERDVLWPYIEKNFNLGLGFNQGEQAAGQPIDHSSKLMLIDSQGRLRGYYDSLDSDPEEMATLLRDARRLLKAARSDA